MSEAMPLWAEVRYLEWSIGEPEEAKLFQRVMDLEHKAASLRTQLEEARADLSVMTQARNELTQQLAARDAEAAELRASLQAAIQRAEKAERMSDWPDSIAEAIGIQGNWGLDELTEAIMEPRAALAAARKALEEMVAILKWIVNCSDSEMGDGDGAREMARAALERINGEGHETNRGTHE